MAPWILGKLTHAGMRFWAPTMAMGPGAGTMTADPDKAATFRVKAEAVEQASLSDRYGQPMTLEEAWQAVADHPLPSYSKSAERLAAEVARRGLSAKPGGAPWTEKCRGHYSFTPTSRPGFDRIRTVYRR